MLYRGDDRARLAKLADTARRAQVPLIAVNDVLYHAPERRPLQDVLTCIREHLTLADAGRRLTVNAERHLKPAAEMARLFRDCPEAVTETLRLSEQLTFSLDELRYEYPDETRAGFATPQEALAHFTYAGAAKRYPDGIPDKVRKSLDYELALIASLNYAPYFLTVHDIVRYAREQGILCQGRGSAANSAVCFCLGITEVDPDRIDLLFERFVSAERREPPDIDVDFEHERREEVIQYIYGKYGRERAGLAATVISYRGRSAVREVGKAFALSEDTIGAVTSSIWGGGGSRLRDEDLRRAGLDARSGAVRKMLTHGRRDRLLPAPSVAARRRLRHHPRTARRGGADPQCGDARPHLRRMGQGRSRRAGYLEDRRARAGHAHLPAQGAGFAGAALSGSFASPRLSFFTSPCKGEVARRSLLCKRRRAGGGQSQCTRRK